MALKPENGAFLAKVRPPNAGFKQKRPKNGLLSAGFSRPRPSRCRTEGVQSAKHYKNRGPDASKKIWRLGRRPLSEKVWVGLGSSGLVKRRSQRLRGLEDPSVGP